MGVRWILHTDDGRKILVSSFNLTSGSLVVFFEARGGNGTSAVLWSLVSARSRPFPEIPALLSSRNEMWITVSFEGAITPDNVSLVASGVPANGMCSCFMAQFRSVGGQ